MLAAGVVLSGLRGVLVEAYGATDATFFRVAIDSRDVRPGDLFFAIKGEHHDGHDFVGQAIQSGATGVVVEREVDAPEDVAVFQVENSVEALQRLATYWRLRRAVRVIGVTGSVGKTTAKELIADVLSKRFRVLKNEANMNTEIGLPLTLLQLTREHQRVVLEMGMHARGDIALLADIAKPQIGVVTNIGPVHMERLGSMAEIVAAKAELVEGLPTDSLAVLNGDDPLTLGLAERTRAQVMLYGQSGQCHVRARDVWSHGLGGIEFRMDTNVGSTMIHSPLPGRHHIYPALAAAGVGLNEGLDIQDIKSVLAQARPQLRMRVLPGPNGSTLIDDTYNASPPSMLAALDLLSDLPWRHIALLGDMRELGPAEEEGNQTVGQRAATACDILFLIGERARPIGEAADFAGLFDIRYVDSHEDAVEALQREARQGDFILIKASRALELERVVDALVAR